MTYQDDVSSSLPGVPGSLSTSLEARLQALEARVQELQAAEQGARALFNKAPNVAFLLNAQNRI